MGLRAWWVERSDGEKVAVALSGACCLVPALIAVVVVAAAVLGTFVLGVGESTGSGGEAVGGGPEVEFAFEYGDGTVEIVHAGGEGVQAGALRIEVGGTTSAWPGTGTVSAGDSARVPAERGETVRVVWSGAEGEEATLGVFEVPG